MDKVEARGIVQLQEQKQHDPGHVAQVHNKDPSREEEGPTEGRSRKRQHEADKQANRGESVTPVNDSDPWCTWNRKPPALGPRREAK